MKTFIKWLIDNNFIIIREYNPTTKTMIFTKDSINYYIDPEFTGTKVISYNIYIGENILGKFICSGKTQKELIEEFEKYLNK